LRHKAIPWYRRLKAVLKIPYDLVCYVVTGNMDLLQYKFKSKEGD